MQNWGLEDDMTTDMKWMERKIYFQSFELVFLAVLEI